MHGSASHSVPMSGWEYTEVKAAGNHVWSTADGGQREFTTTLQDK